MLNGRQVASFGGHALNHGGNVCVFTDPRISARSYTLIVTRTPPDVTGLALSSGALSPAFSNGILNYTAQVPLEVDKTTLRATFGGGGGGITASVGIAGETAAAISSGVSSGEIDLAEGENIIHFVIARRVSSPLGSWSATYRIAVTRTSLPFASEQADLLLHGDVPLTLVLPAADGAPPYTYTVSDNLPAGLSFNASARTISGRPMATPSTTTLSDITYSAVDSTGLEGQQTFEIRVTEQPVFKPPPAAAIVLPRNAVARTTLPAMRGGHAPRTYALSGTLPDGLAFSTATRVLSGTPSALADAALTYTAKDKAGTAGAASGILTAEIRIRVLAFDLDVDNTGAINVQDGIMVARYLLGVRGAALLDGQNDGDAAAATRIGGNIQDGADLGALDVDADSDVDWMDGVLLARYLLGLRDEVLVAGMDGAVAATVAGNVRALL
ncbi:MAG: putative Ig domain-containing protein [Gammaproteobacteria bacterium]